MRVRMHQVRSGQEVPHNIHHIDGYRISAVVFLNLLFKYCTHLYKNSKPSETKYLYVFFMTNIFIIRNF